MAEQEQPDERNIPIEWKIPETIKNQPATHVLIQRDGPEFIINFFELRPPLITGTPEEQAMQITDLDSIQATCVARLIVAVDRMPNFIQAFAEAFDLPSPWA